MKRLSHIFVVMIAVLAIAGPAWAGAAKMSIDPSRVQWDAQGDFERAVLTVSMPDGEVVRQEFDSKQTPIFELAAGAKDGAYTYELRLEARIDTSLRKALAEARKSGNETEMSRLRAQLPESTVVSGGFRVEAGSFVMPEGPEPPATHGRRVSTSAAGTPRNVTAADQVIPDDLIVQGSLCVGFDCVNNENFGFDTIRLKENNTRIKFEDTSVGTFPTNDWQLTANDSASGGLSKFSIEDITGSRVPFTIEAGATTNSIYTDSTGRVGFRTSTPVLDLHVNTSNTPAIRLEQNNSGGFTAQTWDIGANEANFFVRDVTGGSLLSFRIRPGAPTSSVDISADGDVGVGTGSPSSSLHVLRSNGTAKVLIEENNGTNASRELLEMRNLGGVAFILDDESDASRWTTSNVGSQYLINNQANAGVEVTVTATGSMTIAGTLTQNSDRTTKTDIEAVDPDAVLAKVAALPISTWRKIGEDDTHLGPMAQDFSAAFGLGNDNRRVAPLDVAGVSLAAIQALHKDISEKDAEISDLKQKNDEMAKRLADLEALVSSLAAKQ